MKYILVFILAQCFCFLVYSQNVGVGTSDPLATFHVALDSSKSNGFLVTGKFTSFTNLVPMPRLPPKSPRKNSGPMPRPISILPLPVVIACECDRVAEKSKMPMSTNVRTPGTNVLIDTDFWF